MFCCYSRSKPYKPLDGEAPIPKPKDNEISISDTRTSVSTSLSSTNAPNGKPSSAKAIRARSSDDDKLQLQINTGGGGDGEAPGRLVNTRAADARSPSQQNLLQNSQSPSTQSGSQSPSSIVVSNAAPAATTKRTALPTLVRAGSVPERKFDTKGSTAVGPDSRLERQGSFPKPVLRRSSSFAGDPKQQSMNERKHVRFSGLDSGGSDDSDSDSDSDSDNGKISVRNLSQSNIKQAPPPSKPDDTRSSPATTSTSNSRPQASAASSSGSSSSGSTVNVTVNGQSKSSNQEDKNASEQSFASNSSGVLLTPPSSNSLSELPISEASRRSATSVNASSSAQTSAPAPAPVPVPVASPPPKASTPQPPPAQSPPPAEKKAPEPPKKAAPTTAASPPPETKKDEKKDDKGKELASARYKIEYSPGKITDKYEITDTFLGSGAFGVVKLAIGKNLPPGQAEFAVKIIPRSNMILKDAEFMEEVEVLSRMHHQNIISLVDKYETDQNVYLVMELASGGELFERIIEEKKLDEKEVRFISAQLFEAIAYLHAQGICHRDLKPENILFKENQRWSPIKVTDFGFAKHLNNAQQLMRASAKRGTMGYAAPEIFSGKPYSEKCDVWSAGIIVYIMLSGVPPFCELPPPDQALRIPFWRHANKMKKIPTSTPEFPLEFWRGISDNAKHFLTQALNPDPVKRARAIDLCRHPWLKPEKNKAVATATLIATGPLPNVNAKLSLR